MTYLSKTQINELAELEDAFCISIFIPTHRSGQAVLKGEDKIQLKNQVKEIRQKLAKEGLTENEVTEKLSPLRKLINDKSFWSHQREGLALFLSDGVFREYRLPLSFTPANHVTNGFYLKPLLPLFAGDGRYFLLTLGLANVRFYVGNRYELNEITIADLAPTRLEEVVGKDYEPAFLQFRSQQEGHGGATFHGHGEGKDDRKKEIINFLRAINKGLMNRLHDENLPMIIASQQYLGAMYKEVNTYPHLVEASISSDPSQLKVNELHEKAWDIMAPIFDQERQEKMAAFDQHLGKGKASSDLKEIVPAAINGRVDALFLVRGVDIWGKYDPVKGVIISETPHISDVSLTNLAALKVFQQGGKVYLSERSKLPDAYSEVNALYRY